MPGTIRITLNNEGIRELAKGAELLADLTARAQAVAAAAEARKPVMADGEIEIRTEAHEVATRATVRVLADHPGAMAAEAKHRFLGSSVDAARG